MRRFIAALFTCFIACASVHAQGGVATFDFSGTTSSSFNTTNSTYVDSGVAVSVSSSLSASTTAVTNGLKVSNWTTSTSLDSTQYIQFGFHVAQSINIDSLTLNAVLGSSGPTSLELKFSSDGGASYHTVGSPITAVNGQNTFSSLSISDVPAGTFPAGYNFIRIYGYNASNTVPSNNFFELFSDTAAPFNAIYMPFTPAPEPTSMIALSCVGLSALGFKLRRKKAAAV